jgi:cytochrome P450
VKTDASGRGGPSSGTGGGMADQTSTYGGRDSYSQIGDRFHTFEEMRSRGAAIRQGDAVIATTRAAAEEIFRHPEQYSSQFPPIGRAVRPLIPIQVDPPEHHRYRRLLDPMFAPRAIESLEPTIARLVNEHIDRFEARGECVFDEELAVPLPSQVFLMLMGLPLEDTDLLLELKDGVLRPGYRQGIDMSDADAISRIGDETARRIYDYFQTFVDERRRLDPRDDIMGRVLETEVDGTRLTDEEILDACFLLLIAGLDTITNSLTLFYHQLTERPALRQRIVDDPGVIPSAVEELLRWETPTPMVFRVAVSDGDLGGVPIRAHDQIVVDLGAADTDPAFQADAGEIDFDRDPNPHFAFSGGIHRCSGSHLARQELRITMREWHRRIPDYWVKEGTEPIWPPGLRSVENLVLEWRA